MQCIGWKSPKDCVGRMDQVIAPGATCPSIIWFWLGAAGVVLAAVMQKK
jgi:hypothetical protein